MKGKTMTLDELIAELEPMQAEYGGFDVVVPTGMDCALAQRVELVFHDQATSKTSSVGKKRPTAAAKIVILVSPSNEPRP